MKTKKFLFYLLAALLGGCIPVMSLNPLYTEKDVVFDERLLGSWTNEPNDRWEFKRSEKPQKAYELVLSSRKEEIGSFTVYLVKLGDYLFMDTFPNKFPCKDEFVEKNGLPLNKSFYIPFHTFLKIASIEPELKMYNTDDDELEKLFRQDPNAVEHSTINGQLILTASTKELQKFMLNYAEDSRVFPNEITLSHKKTKETEKPSRQDPNNLPGKDKKESAKDQDRKDK